MTDNLATELEVSYDSKRLQKMSIAELRAKVGIYSMIIKEAQRDGDDRWRNLVLKQRVLNETLTAKLKQERAAKGIPEPQPVGIALNAIETDVKRPGLQRCTPNMGGAGRVGLVHIQVVAMTGTISIRCLCGRTIQAQLTQPMQPTQCLCGITFQPVCQIMITQ